MKSSHAHWIESGDPDADPGEELRDSGIPVMNGMSWGSHVCLFYETQLDLFETNAAYFQAGLKANEFCLWVISHPADFEVATEALRRSIPDVDERLKSGQLEMIRGAEHYLPGGKFDMHRIIGGWNQKLGTALARGFAGMRGSGDALWAGTSHWRDFLGYELELDRSLEGQKIIMLCTYPLAKSRSADLLDVARTHQFTLARRNSAWEFLETPELKHAKREIRKLNGALDVLSNKAFPGQESLSQRERVVLAQIVRGLSSKEIARILDITPRTVAFHRANLLKKTNARTTVDLMRIVLGE